ncbi:hypothetical protein [Alkalimarinus coralli]|uniref:hypothetical protein n=1 Tax=Alkalimarinus coralli TaxID=2935863 RepID=UPI00202AF25E|nr:hypothetical protein [Alkalimarinus coralli]
MARFTLATKTKKPSPEKGALAKGKETDKKSNFAGWEMSARDALRVNTLTSETKP